MIFRIATSTDLHGLAKLCWQFRLEEGETPQVQLEEFIFIFKSAASTNNWVHWIATDQSTDIIAFASIQKIKKLPKPEAPDKWFGYLTNVYVMPDLRDKEIGSELMGQVIAWSNMENLELMIVWPSETSINFYRKNGFQNDHEILQYKKS